MSFQKHQLTTKKQGRYFYTIGPYAKPVLSIKSGDIVVIETQAALGGKLKIKIQNQETLKNCILLTP